MRRNLIEPLSVPSMATTPQAADAALIRRELLGLMLAQNHISVIGNVTVGLTTAVVLWGSGIHDGVAVWLASVLVLVALRSLLVRRVLPGVAALGSSGIAAAERNFTLLVAASGAVWGVLPWLSYTGKNPFVDFFSIAMLVGMAAGAVNAFAALPLALNMYIAAAFAPFIVKSALIGGLVYGAGGVTIAFSGVLMIAFGRSAHRALRNTLVITRQNARLAEALRVERDAVQATMRAKDLFLAGVTHDLRQPVHALALHLRYLRQLRQDELTPQALQSLCAPMDSALKTMSGQLTRLLELSRLEAGEARVARRSIAIAEVLNAAAAQFQPQARDKGLQFRLRCRPAQIDSDPQMLQSIVDNLVGNAVRYTEQGGLLLAARLRGGQLWLEVFDTGPGIAAALLPQIFTAYRRFDDRQRVGDQGQGLGLALARKQADLLGHTLAVRSVPGRGSVFQVSLPLVN